MRRVGRLLLALLLALVAAAGGLVAWLAWRDPLAALPRAAQRAVATGSSVEPRGPRALHHIVLEAPGVGRIGLAASLPDPLPRERLPVVVVLGGLASGERNIRAIPGGGANAVV